MTSVLTAQAVTMLTTTDPFTRAMNLRPDPFIIANVRKFGFEFEMFPRGGVDENGDECEECYGDGCDYCGNPYGNQIYSLMARFRDAGICEHHELCGYHCTCGECVPERSYPFLTAQSDCTVGVEFITRIIDTGSPDDTWRTDIADMVHAFAAHIRRGGWAPDGHASCGNHVHVSSTGDRIPWASSTRESAKNHVNALYAVFDWDDVIDGGCGRVRTYNDKPSTNWRYGSWLADKGIGTFEHRQWNTPRIPERLWAHVGLSIAITRWAFGVALDAPGLNLWDRSAPSHWDPPGMSADMVDRLNDHRDTIVDVIRGYVPDGVEFDGARDLIGALRTY